LRRSRVRPALQPIGDIPKLDRRRIRATFEERFAAKRMTDAYLALNETLVAEPLKTVAGMATRELVAPGLRRSGAAPSPVT
jgi:hypothetical protein